MRPADRRRAAREAAKIREVIDTVECLRALAQWPDGTAPMNCGRLMDWRLMNAGRRGWAVRTEAVDRLGAAIWRMTDLGREVLATWEQAA